MIPRDSQPARARRAGSQSKEPLHVPPSSMRSSSSRPSLDSVSKFSLGRPRPSHSSFDPSSPRQRQPLTRQTFQPAPQLQEQSLTGAHRSYTLLGHTSYPSRPCYRLQHERSFDNGYIKTGKEAALLQRTKQHTIEHIKQASIYTASSPSRSRIEDGAARTSQRSQEIRSAETRQERLRFLKAKQEEARLELLALEQLEKELVEEEDRLAVEKQSASAQRYYSRPNFYHPSSSHRAHLQHNLPFVPRTPYHPAPAPSPSWTSSPFGDNRNSTRSRLRTSHSSDRDLRGALGTTFSSSSPYSRSPLYSPSPPISPLYSSFKHGSFYKDIPSDTEDVFHGHLNECQEDLRDVTLTEMMNKHLVLLSDSDETDLSDHEKDQGQAQAADETIVDRTCMFMSNLEQDFDRQMAMGEGIPSFLGNTVLENMYGLSFMDFASQKDEYDYAAPMGTKTPHAQLQKPAFLSPRLQSSREITHKGSIPNDFLSSHPSPPQPLPRSLEAQRPLVPIQPSSRAASKPSHFSADRNVPLPAPVATSHEECEMISKRHSRRDSAHSTGSLGNISVESSLSSSSSSAPRTPQSEYSTSLTSYDPPFDIQSLQVATMGTNDPRTETKALEQENPSHILRDHEKVPLKSTTSKTLGRATSRAALAMKQAHSGAGANNASWSPRSTISSAATCDSAESSWSWSCISSPGHSLTSSGNRERPYRKRLTHSTYNSFRLTGGR